MGKRGRSDRGNAQQSTKAFEEELEQFFVVQGTAAEVPFPGYALWAGQMVIIKNGHSPDIPTLLAEIGMTHLQDCGFEEVEVEQQKFISEVLSKAFETQDYKKCQEKLRILFTSANLSLLLEYLHIDIFEFAVSLQTILEWETVSEWADPKVRNNPTELEAMLELAVCVFTDAENSRSKLPKTTRFLAKLVLGCAHGNALFHTALGYYEFLEETNGKVRRCRRRLDRRTSLCTVPTAIEDIPVPPNRCNRCKGKGCPRCDHSGVNIDGSITDHTGLNIGAVPSASGSRSSAEK